VNLQQNKKLKFVQTTQFHVTKFTSV